MANKTVKYTKEFIRKNIIEEFVYACLDQGMTKDKSFELLKELLTLVEKKQFEEHIWQGLINQAVEVANSKGVDVS